MANVLIVDNQGRRRVALEVAAGDAGHKTYSAGSVHEAMRMAGIYVPSAIIISLTEPDSAQLIKSLRASDNVMLQTVPVITPYPSANGHAHVTVVKPDAAGILAAIGETSRPSGDGT